MFLITKSSLSCLVLPPVFYLPNRKLRMGTSRCWTGHDDRTASSFCSLLPFSFIEKFGIGNERHFWIKKVRGFLKIASEVELRILVSVGRGSWLLRALNLGTMMAKDVVNTFYTAPTLHWQNVLFIYLCTFACFFFFKSLFVSYFVFSPHHEFCWRSPAY